MCQAAAAADYQARVQLINKMSLKTVGTAVTRTLWTRGNSTPPPVARAHRVSRLSTTCRESAGGKQGRENTKEQSCGSCSDRPCAEAPSSGEPPHRCQPGDAKRAKEPAGAPGVTGARRRLFTSTKAPVDQRSYLWSRYNDLKRLVHGKQSRERERAPLFVCVFVCVSVSACLPHSSSGSTFTRPRHQGGRSAPCFKDVYVVSGDILFTPCLSS